MARAEGKEEAYCVCRQPATAPETMLTCMDCQRWFHINCVLPKDSDVTLLSRYYCEECQNNNGRQLKWLKGTGKGKKKRKQDDTAHIPENTSHNASTENSNNKEGNVPKRAREQATENSSPLKQEPLRRSARNKVKHNYSELNDGAEQEVIADKSIVVDYVKMLKKAKCVRSEEVPMKVKGEDLTVAFLSKSGFREPMIVDDLESLDMKMPPSTITVHRIKELVGATRQLDVIEVPTQSEMDPKWTMEQWAEYYHTPIEKRDKILNVISLEISKTPLNAQVRSPRVVREIDWIDNVWPHRMKTSNKYPQVQVYCLMSVQNAYTDFHIDFGGSSVWYHVVKGEKVFYLIPPTKDNLQKYATWSSSPRQNKVWFGNLVPTCYEARVKPGQTFFIPTGWIHAVFTPLDSLVFGGNFLHGLNCRLQLDIYDIELTTHVPDKFQFPLYRTLMWFAALHYVDALRDGSAGVNKWELDSARAILDTLSVWVEDIDKAQQDIPQKVKNPNELLDDLERLLDEAEVEAEQKKDDLKDEVKKEELSKSGDDTLKSEAMQTEESHAPLKKNYKKKSPATTPLLNGKSKEKTPTHTPAGTPKTSPSQSPITSPSPTPSSLPHSTSSIPRFSPSPSHHEDAGLSRFPPPAPPKVTDQSLFEKFSYPYSRPSSSYSHSSPFSSSYPPSSQYGTSPYNNYSNGYNNEYNKYNNKPQQNNHMPNNFVQYPPPYTNPYKLFASPSSSHPPSHPSSSSHPPSRPSHPPSHPSSSHPSSHPSSSHLFSELLNLTNAAESIEQESYEEKYNERERYGEKYRENTNYNTHNNYNNLNNIHTSNNYKIEKYEKPEKYEKSEIYYGNGHSSQLHTNPSLHNNYYTNYESRPNHNNYETKPNYENRTNQAYPHENPYYPSLPQNGNTEYNNNNNNHNTQNGDNNPIKKKGSLSFILNSRGDDQGFPF